jgi:hypothetical protein
MPRKDEKAEVPPVDDTELTTRTEITLPDDDWIASLRSELLRAQQQVFSRVGEDLQLRADLNRRLLQDLWEIHNLFEDISVHVTMEPSQTIFATFTDFPHKWAFKETFDFASVKNFELKDRSTGWLGQALKIWYYTTEKGETRLRAIYEWCEGESYHKYSGWMRIMTQAVLFDESAEKVNVGELHRILKDVVMAWYTSHLNHDPTILISHLKEKYPKGATQARESFRT